VRDGQQEALTSAVQRFGVNARTYTLIGRDGKPFQSETKGQLGGYRKDRIYGRLDCANALRWLEKGHYAKQRVFFADESTAKEAGYRPCARCMPAEYAKWKAASGAAK
jgi:hypothetical protein